MKKSLSGVIGIIGIALAVIPISVYNLIEAKGMMHGMTMACKSSWDATLIIGLLIAIVSFASLFLKSRKTRITCAAAEIIGGIAVIAAPPVIGLCKSDDMACRYITMPTVAILGGAVIVLAAVRLFIAVKEPEV